VDSLIKRFDAVWDGDLMLCPHRGVAFQRDLSHRVAYDAGYFDKCRGYEGRAIANKINRGRIDLVDRHVGAGTSVLDVGIGCGEFIKRRPGTFGTDINPAAVEWLKAERRYSDDFSGFRAFSFWDVIEHVEDPELYFRAMPDGSHLFCSLPMFDDLTRIRASRHYRPGEHLYYFTEPGFVDWMALHRFKLIERADYETAAGRDSITSFAFVKSLPGYHDTLAQYRQLYAPFYGASAHLYFDAIADLVLRRKPASVLDYGCGRSDLVAHFWADGGRRIAKYDPAIPGCELLPEGAFDLVLCCDVLEHVLMADVDKVLSEIREKSRHAVFTVSLRPARARLPDGRNAHVTLLSAEEWTRWIGEVFGAAQRRALRYDHIALLTTF